MSAVLADVQVEGLQQWADALPPTNGVRALGFVAVVVAALAADEGDAGLADEVLVDKDIGFGREADDHGDAGGVGEMVPVGGVGGDFCRAF